MEVDSEAEVEAWEVAVAVEVAMEEVLPVEVSVVLVEVAMMEWVELAVALKQVDVDVRMGRSAARAELAVAVEGLVLATVHCPLLDLGREGISKRPLTST